MSSGRGAVGKYNLRTMKPRGSKKATQFTESVIREMTRLAQDHHAVNLSQVFPIRRAQRSSRRGVSGDSGDINHYPITWGENLREALRGTFRGATACRESDPGDGLLRVDEAMLSTLLAVLDPGDEVVIFEPYYENYGPDSIISGAVPRFVRLREPDWTFDEQELAAAFNDRTRAIIINTPNNPTGKVFTRSELQVIAALCQKWDVLAITDKSTALMYDGHKHVPIATVEGMADRTVTITACRASRHGLARRWRLRRTIAGRFERCTNSSGRDPRRCREAWSRAVDAGELLPDMAGDARRAR